MWMHYLKLGSQLCLWTESRLNESGQASRKLCLILSMDLRVDGVGCWSFLHYLNFFRHYLKISSMCSSSLVSIFGMRLSCVALVVIFCLLVPSSSSGKLPILLLGASHSGVHKAWEILSTHVLFPSTTKSTLVTHNYYKPLLSLTIWLPSCESPPGCPSH